MSDWALGVGGFRPFVAGDIAANDRGFLLGDGVFETVRFGKDGFVHSDLHEERLNKACTAFDLPMPDWNAVERAAMTAVSQAVGIARLTISRGSGPRGLGVIENPTPRVCLTVSGAQARPETLSLKTVSIRRSPSSPAARFKTLSYGDNSAARRDAVKTGAEMALLLTSDGHVSGGDCANVFAIQGDELLTPSLDCAIRPGVTREIVLCLVREMGLSVQEGQFTLEQFIGADTIFVTNTAMGVAPVASLDGRVIDTTHAGLEAIRQAEARASIRG